MKTPIWTWLPGSHEPVQAGELEILSDRGRVVYAPDYLDTDGARALDPVHLALSRKARGISVPTDKGFPGVVIDAMPAGYGADRLIEAAERNLSFLELLEAGPPDGVGSIEVCRNLDAKLAWQPIAERDLIQKIHTMGEEVPTSRSIRHLNGQGSTSSGGERPKITLERNGKLWLAKPQDRGDTPHLPAREFVVMTLAQACGIDVPPIHLHRDGPHEVFLIERFDRAGDPRKPERHLFASAHTALGLDFKTLPGDPRRSYLVLADKLRQWVVDPQAQMADCHQLWKRMAFNALCGNSDDHPRNHGLLHRGEGWRLSPAFDITPSAEFKGVLAMAVTATNSALTTVENLIGSTPHFTLDPTEAAAWLVTAARVVADGWLPKMLASGVDEAVAQRFAPAFALATALARQPASIEAALNTAQVEWNKAAHRRARTRRPFLDPEKPV